jgi:hypothetical protein
MWKKSTTDYTDSTDRRIGCDGVNTVCGNGHEVGTECSDCWMPHFLHLGRTAVDVNEAGAES